MQLQPRFKKARMFWRERNHERMRANARRYLCHCDNCSGCQLHVARCSERDELARHAPVAKPDDVGGVSAGCCCCVCVLEVGVLM